MILCDGTTEYAIHMFSSPGICLLMPSRCRLRRLAITEYVLCGEISVCIPGLCPALSRLSTPDGTAPFRRASQKVCSKLQQGPPQWMMEPTRSRDCRWTKPRHDGVLAVKVSKGQSLKGTPQRGPKGADGMYIGTLGSPRVILMRNMGT